MFWSLVFNAYKKTSILHSDSNYRITNRVIQIHKKLCSLKLWWRYEPYFHTMSAVKCWPALCHPIQTPLDLKGGTPLTSHFKVCLQFSGGTLLHMWNTLYKYVCGSRGSSVKSCPEVWNWSYIKSFGGWRLEIWKWKRIWWCGERKKNSTDLCSSSLREATLAVSSTIIYNWSVSRWVTLRVMKGRIHGVKKDNTSGSDALILIFIKCNAKLME